MTVERVPFRLFQMPCCGFLLCWINPRKPSYCPECGQPTLGELGLAVRHMDDNAELHLTSS